MIPLPPCFAGDTKTLYAKYNLASAYVQFHMYVFTGLCTRLYKVLQNLSSESNKQLILISNNVHDKKMQIFQIPHFCLERQFLYLHHRANTVSFSVMPPLKSNNNVVLFYDMEHIHKPFQKFSNK